MTEIETILEEAKASGVDLYWQDSKGYLAGYLIGDCIAAANGVINSHKKGSRAYKKALDFASEFALSDGSEEKIWGDTPKRAVEKEAFSVWIISVYRKRLNDAWNRRRREEYNALIYQKVNHV